MHSYLHMHQWEIPGLGMFGSEKCSTLVRWVVLKTDDDVF